MYVTVNCVDFFEFSCYIYFMTITQTIEVPANRRQMTIDIPREIPAGVTVITFTPVSASKRTMTKAEEIEYINRNADGLNREAEDVLLYQDMDSFEDDLERLTPGDIAAMRGTVVQFNHADIVFDRKKDHSV